MKKEKKIITSQLMIVGNIMAWADSALQLSNVSSISTVPLELIPFPLWTLLILLVGIFAFKVSWLPAVAFIAIAIGSILYWHQKNEELKLQRNLLILMNSGITFSFLFRDQQFLEKVFNVLSSIIAEAGKEERQVKININNSTISGNAKVLSDMFIS